MGPGHGPIRRSRLAQRPRRIFGQPRRLDARRQDRRLMNADRRGWRIALLADTLVNPPETPPTTRPLVLAVIEACGYGLMQLPPPGEHRLLLAVIADQLAEYLHHGYAVAA